ncbi:Phytoene dehydrogenase-related protein [Jatrophihabitans endophyticus]|uniref:Pyridine nucleotide-disulfide oxidoreductase domain-containing protein 2 n=1 Tax=Jatrophihabitans endophyticus TaxID=1206085 RepID=A0A1M5DVV2_9ACTN|nr:NAD(P)/FAD-dependent oxidoreductase [Jatrophihabitans endophyticus]SHF70952.1 Phytoene dehydrogenase-related protein [Jatrophihabitans endophyticus]
MTVDAVVVGAGHNGLVAANLLADAGWDVLVCEAAPHPGGAVATADDVTAPGFRTDLFSAFYPLAAASPVIQGLALDRHGVEWTRAPAVLTHLLPDGRSATLWQDAARTAAGLGGADGEAWLRLTAQWDRIGEQVVRALLAPFPPTRTALGILRRLGTAETLRLARMAAQPVRRFGEENFTGPGGPILFAGNALHADLPPDGAGSAIYGWLLTMLAHAHGFPVPVGGAAVLVDGLVRRLRAAGGELRTSTPVEGIDVVDGRAVGVRLAGGERIAVRRAVLADVAAPALYGDLVGHDHLPPAMVADLARFQWDAPTLKVDWALRTPVPWTDPDARQAGTVHLGVDLDGLTDYAADLATRRVPREPFLLFGQMTTADATRSPAGTESAWAYTHLPRGVTLTDDVVAEQVERIEAVLERRAPGFGASVLARHVQSPYDLETHDANLVTGAINGGTAQLHQQLVFRPVPGLGGAATPIDQLFLAGSSAHPGGGVHGACGSNAARAALARHGVTGGVRRSVQNRLLNHIYR